MNVDKFLNKDYTDEGEWHEFQEGVKLKIKILTPKENNALLKQATTTFKGGRVRIDDLLYRKLVKQSAVVGWEGLTFGKEGKTELPCTPENVLFLMDNCTEFAEFVNGILASNENEVIVVSEEAAKN